MSPVRHLLTGCGVVIAALVSFISMPALAADNDHLLMVFIKPKEGREAEFHQWYQGQHLDEVMERPGFVSGQVFVGASQAGKLTGTNPSPVMVNYRIVTDDLEETFRIDSELAQASRLQDPPHEAGFTRSFAMTKTGPLMSGAGADYTGEGELAVYQFYCLQNSAVGCHTEQVLRMPGVVSAQAYQRSEIQRYSGADSASQMVVFRLVTDNVGLIFDRLAEQGVTFETAGQLGESNPMAFVYRALGYQATAESYLSSDAASMANDSIKSLLARVKALEDKSAINELLSKYSLNVDIGRQQDFMALFTEDCIFATDIGGELNYRRGKSGLYDMIKDGPPPLGQHVQFDYHINLKGDSAQALGYQVLTNASSGTVKLARPAFRVINLRRENNQWLIHELYTVGIDNKDVYEALLPDHF